MEINLKEHVKSKEILKSIQYKLRNDKPISSTESNRLNKIISFLDDIEVDLELGGESIVELDKPRLEAIEEKNKMLSFLKQEDDV